jgi:hypothetical protein
VAARSAAVAVVAAGVAVMAHAGARQARPYEADASDPIAPSAGVLRVASLGRPTLAASVLWMQVGAQFAETEDLVDPETSRWIHQSVLTCGELDPDWAAPWIFGAMMLERQGDVDAHEDVLRRAMDRWPDEPWFPFTLGMSRYRNRGDATGAIGWIERAAAIPGADPAYARALGSMRARHPQVPK